MSVIVAIPTEKRPEERRVALDPAMAMHLREQGYTVRIEAECGTAAGFMTQDYGSVDVAPSFEETVAGADVVIKVSPPTLEEIAALPRGVVLITLMSAFQHLEEVQALMDRGVTTLAMDLIPRITRAQSMDALSSQATVAGYKAALLAAHLSPRLFPMLTTAAGSIRPSRVIVIGAGVAGLQAIATARRLGAQVEAYDIRSAAREQIESLGARMIDTGVEAEGLSGYARGLKKSEKQKQHDVLAEHFSRAHVVICAAAIPGRRAPRIVTADMVDGMMIDTVIVDMAADTGGNCELTRPGENYLYQRTLIAGPVNLASHGAFHASEMYARNVSNTLKLCVNEQGKVFLDPEDEIIAGCILTHRGSICHEATARLLSVPVLNFGEIGSADVETSAKDNAVGWINEPEQNLAELSESRQAAVDPDRTEKPLDEAPQQGVIEDRELQGAENKDINTEGIAALGSSASSDKANSETPRIDRVQAEMPMEESSTSQNELEDANLSAGVSDLARLDGVAMPVDNASMDESELLGPPDDLTVIDGVGPAMQTRLMAFGIHRLEQLAELDELAIRQLSDQLELDDDRIMTDDWPGQARRAIEEVGR